MNNLGHKGSSEKIKSCLEESLVLFDWDRPTIVSPVKLVNILYLYAFKNILILINIFFPMPCFFYALKIIIGI